LRFPIDAAALWQRYQDWLYYHEGLEFYLDVSRMRLMMLFVEALRPASLSRRFSDMAALEGGDR